LDRLVRKGRLFIRGSSTEQTYIVSIVNNGFIEAAGGQTTFITACITQLTVLNQINETSAAQTGALSQQE